MPFAWTADLSVGDPVIDEQHRELFARTNALLEAMMCGRGAAEVDRLLAFLTEYVCEHFATEEQAMAQAGYPELASHAAEHRHFAGDVACLRAEIAGGDGLAHPVVALQRRVCDWLVNHVQHSDQAVALYLRGR